MNVNEECVEFAMTQPAALTGADLRTLAALTQPAAPQELAVTCDFGVKTVALIHCRGHLNEKTSSQLSHVIENAIKQEYRILIVDFTYCACDEAIVPQIFNAALGSGVTLLTVAALSALTHGWMRPLPHPLDALNRLGCGLSTATVDVVQESRDAIVTID